MLEITVTGNITAFKECRTDIEAYIFLQEIKDRHDNILRPVMPPKPDLYYYAPKTQISRDHVESNKYRLEVRKVTKPYALKVSIRTVDDGEDLI